ncbi:MAG: hypothetical protein L6Q95_15470 [Planctomycetes bacterium]|nr:hypothetical protein [Planctomycetota bacterium]
MRSRLGSAAIHAAAGFLLGAAALAGGQGDEDLREKLIELESLSARLRALEAGSGEAPAVDERGLELDRIHITDLHAGVPDYVGPRPRVGETSVFGGRAEEAPQTYGTVEEILEIVRTSVRPEAWESGSQIQPFGQSLLLLAPPDVSRAARAFIDTELRLDARRTVNLQIGILEAEEPLAAALAAATGGDIDPALRARIEEAAQAGKARRVFDGRVLALSRQQIAFWHGAQAATVVDADVEVAARSAVADPFVGVELLGTRFEARATVADDPARVRLRISLASDEMDLPPRAAETGDTGELQMPAGAMARIDADLWTGNDRWTVAAERSAHGRRRFLLVRPSVIGGAR